MFKNYKFLRRVSSKLFVKENLKKRGIVQQNSGDASNVEGTALLST
jgi:hypothetical protein